MFGTKTKPTVKTRLNNQYVVEGTRLGNTTIQKYYQVEY